MDIYLLEKMTKNVGFSTLSQKGTRRKQKERKGFSLIRIFLEGLFATVSVRVELKGN